MLSQTDLFLQVVNRKRLTKRKCLVYKTQCLCFWTEKGCVLLKADFFALHFKLSIGCTTPRVCLLLRYNSLDTLHPRDKPDSRPPSQAVCMCGC